MDYKNKCLQLLKNIQKGGAGLTIIPNNPPPTWSFLYMPMIYYALDKNSVTLPDGLPNLINNISTEYGFDINTLQFFNHLRNQLANNNINTIADVEKLRDSAYHIPGTTQEQITNYNDDPIVGGILGPLGYQLVQEYPGEKFIYRFESPWSPRR